MILGMLISGMFASIAASQQPAFRGGGNYVFVNAEAAAFVARMTTQPDNSRKAVIDIFFGAIKVGALSGSNILNKMDALWLLAAGDSQAAGLNLIGASYTFSVMGTPAFAADKGYTFNGTNARLDTGFNPTTAAGHYSLNSANMGLYSMTPGQGSTLRGDMGADLGLCSMICRTSTDTVQVLINRSTLMSGNTGVTDGSGHFCGSRVSSANLKAYRNGVQIGSMVLAVGALANANIAIGASVTSGPTVYSSRRMTAAHIGGGLTQNETTDLANALAAYMTAVGA